MHTYDPNYAAPGYPAPPAYAAAPAAFDPFVKVRRLGVTVIAFLALRASMRAITYGVFKVLAPSSGRVTMEQVETMRTVDMALLGIENLVGLVAMISFFVWIHAVFVAVRATGQRTSTSPGMAVGGWFIPFANLVLPCLSVREALESMGRPGILAVGWWLVWFVNIGLLSLHQTFRQIMLVPELADVIGFDTLHELQQALVSSTWWFFATDTLAWGSLAVIVAMIRRAAEPPLGVARPAA